MHKYNGITRGRSVWRCAARRFYFAKSLRGSVDFLVLRPRHRLVLSLTIPSGTKCHNVLIPVTFTTYFSRDPGSFTSRAFERASLIPINQRRGRSRRSRYFSYDGKSIVKFDPPIVRARACRKAVEVDRAAVTKPACSRKRRLRTCDPHSEQSYPAAPSFRGTKTGATCSRLN